MSGFFCRGNNFGMSDIYMACVLLPWRYTDINAPILLPDTNVVLATLWMGDIYIVTCALKYILYFFCFSLKFLKSILWTHVSHDFKNIFGLRCMRMSIYKLIFVPLFIFTFLIFYWRTAWSYVLGNCCILYLCSCRTHAHVHVLAS